MSHLGTPAKSGHGHVKVHVLETSWNPLLFVWPEHLSKYAHCIDQNSAHCCHPRCRELQCPSGTWSVNWLTELDKHVRPEIAVQVRQLMDILIQLRDPTKHCTEQVASWSDKWRAGHPAYIPNACPL
jgi:hypothetical protein